MISIGSKQQLFALASLFVIRLCAASSEIDSVHEFDEKLMRSTIRISSGACSGTGFILFDRISPESNIAIPLLVTAAHVLSDIPSANITLGLRTSEEGPYKRMPTEIAIRKGGTNLWTQHPNADVAVIRISFPRSADFGGLSSELLTDDEFVRDYHIHPGDEVRVLGFPYGFEANNSGFPVLRSGRIASYPLVPTTNYSTFTIDFRVFPGNSGGPVYISERRAIAKGSLISVSIHGIMGLVSKEAKFSETVTSLNERSTKTHELGIGIIIPSVFIKETIALLPPLNPSRLK